MTAVEYHLIAQKIFEKSKETKSNIFTAQNISDRELKRKITEKFHEWIADCMVLLTHCYAQSHERTKLHEAEGFLLSLGSLVQDNPDRDFYRSAVCLCSACFLKIFKEISPYSIRIQPFENKNLI